MATDDRKVQLGVTVDATEARKGFSDVKDSARDMAQSVAAQGAAAGNAIDSIGSGGSASAQKVDAATRSMIQSIQRTTAAMEAGSKSSSQYYEALAQQRGIPTDVLAPYLAQLDAAKEKQESAAQSMAGADLAAQRFMQTLQSQAQALKDQVATFGMSRNELLAYQAAQMGASEAAAPLIAQIAQQEGLLKSLRESTVNTAAAVSAFGETEAEASARIKDMVARSREAQEQMDAAASATKSAAASNSSFGASSEDVRATITAQNAAMSATAREMTSLDTQMAALTAGMATGSSTFRDLETQFGRLDLLMANGRLSTEELAAAQASLWKNEDRLLAQTNGLVDRYDVLGVATRKLASDEALLEDAYKTGQVTTAQYEKTMAGISADQASVQLKVLAQQESQLEQQLKSGQISLASYKKELAGIGAQKADFSALITQVNGASDATNHLGGSTAYARTEMLRLVNDVANGNFSRFEQTGMVLAEQYDLLGQIMTPLGLAIGGVTAAIALSAVTAAHAAESMAAYGENLTKLSQQTGVSTDELQKIGYAIETVGGKSTDSGAALDALAKKLSDARAGSKDAQATFQALGISLSDLKNLSIDEVLGKIADKFSQTADDAGKFAVAQQLFGSASKDMIALLDQGSAGLSELGAQAQNVGAVLDQSTIVQMTRLSEELNTIHANMGAVSMNAKTEMLPVILTITDELADLTNGGSAVSFAFQVMSGVISGTAAVIATAAMPLIVAGQSIATTAQVVYKAATGDFKGAKDALIDGWQDEMNAAKKYADFMQNLFYPKSSGSFPLDFGTGGGWDGHIQEQKQSNNRSAGLIDKTQLQGEVKGVQDALAQELSDLSSAQKQLDALYKSGGISIADYYQKERDLATQKGKDEVNAYNDEAAILKKSLSDKNLSAQQIAQINNQIQADQDKATKAKQDSANAVKEINAKEDEYWAQYSQKQLDATQKQVDAANQQDQALKDQIDTFGMGKHSIDDLVVSRTQDQLAAEEQGLAQAKLNDLAPQVIQNYEAEIDRLKQLLKLRQSIADHQSTLDQLTAEKKVADQTVQDWKSAANSIEGGITNALMNGFNNGKSFGQQLADSLKSLFKTLILQPIIAPIAGGIAGMMYPGAAQAYAQTNPNSSLAGNPLGSMLSYSNLSSAYNTVSGWFGGGYGSASTVLGSSAISGATSGALGSGGVMLGGLGADAGASFGETAASNAYGFTMPGATASANSYGFTMPSTGGFLGTAGSVLGAAGTGYGVGSMVGSLFGGGTAGTGSQVGGAVGGVAGSFFGGPIGTWVGSAIGSALGGLIGSLFGGGETRYGTVYTSNGTTDTKVSAPSGGDPAADQVKSQINTTFQTIQSMATQLGGSIAGLGTYTAGYEVSPKKGNSFVVAGFQDNPNQNGLGHENLSGVKDTTTVLNDFSLQLQRSIIDSLEKANLDKPYADVLKGVNAYSLSSTDVTNLLNELNTLKTLFDSIKTMGSDFNNLKSASTDAQLAVMNLSGGVSQFATNAAYFEQHFVPVAEQTANQAKGVTDQLAALGMSSVKTNDQFRAAVQGIDLSTAAGQQLYVQMLALAPAFDQMTAAAKAAADAQQSLWDNYAKSIYTPEQLLAANTRELQDQFNALGVAMPRTNAEFQALVENMDTSSPAVKALQNSLLALAPAFGQLMQSTQQSVQTALGNVQTAYNNQVQAINANITSITNFITQLTNLKQSLSLGSLSTLSPQDKYLAEKQLFEQTSAAAASGDATAQGNLPQVAQDFLTASQAYNASSQAYVNDYNEVQSALDKNIATAQQQLSMAQQQLNAANQMVQGILDLNTTTQSLAEAVNAYFNAGGTSSAGTSAGGSGIAGSSNIYGGAAGSNMNRAQVEATAVNGLIPYSAANPYGPMGGYTIAEWQAANASVSDATKAAMGMTLGPNGTYGWYSTPVNGSHAGGLDSVPFDGYRAELHKGEAVVTSSNNQKLSQMLSIDWSRYGNSDNAALLSEIKALRTEVAAARQSQQQIGAATLQQSQQQHEENRADMSKQTRHLQNTADATSRTANHTSKLK